MRVALSDDDVGPPEKVSISVASSDEEPLVTNSSLGIKNMRVASSDDNLDSRDPCLMSRISFKPVYVTSSGFKLVTLPSRESFMEIDSDDEQVSEETCRTRNSSCTTVVVDSDDQENFYDIVRVLCKSVHQPDSGAKCVSTLIDEMEVPTTEVLETEVPETEVVASERLSTRKLDSPYYLCDKEKEGEYNDVNTSMVSTSQRKTMDPRWKSLLLKMCRHLDKFRLNSNHTRYLVEMNLFDECYDIGSHLIDVCFRALYHARVRKHELLPFLREQINVLYQYELESMDSLCDDVRCVTESGNEIRKMMEENVKVCARSLEYVLLNVPENTSSFLHVRSSNTSDSMTELLDWVKEQGLNKVFIDRSNNRIIPMSTLPLGDRPSFEQIMHLSYLKSLNEDSSDMESDFEHFKHTSEVQTCFVEYVRKLLKFMVYHKMLCLALEKDDYEECYKLVQDTFSMIDDGDMFASLSPVACRIGIDIASLETEYGDLCERYLDLSKRFVEANNVFMGVVISMTGANFSASLLDSMQLKYLSVRELSFEEKSRVMLFIQRSEDDRKLYTRIVNLIKESTVFPTDSTEFSIDVESISKHVMLKLLSMAKQGSLQKSLEKQKQKGKQSSTTKRKKLY